MKILKILFITLLMMTPVLGLYAATLLAVQPIPADMTAWAWAVTDTVLANAPVYAEAAGTWTTTYAPIAWTWTRENVLTWHGMLILGAALWVPLGLALGLHGRRRATYPKGLRAWDNYTPSPVPQRKHTARGFALGHHIR